MRADGQKKKRRYLKEDLLFSVMADLEAYVLYGTLQLETKQRQSN